MTPAAEAPSGASAPILPSELDEATLLDLSRDGDQTAFAELFRRHYDTAVRIAARTSADFDPQDVAAEAFARVWTAICHGGGPDHAFRPYLATAVRNVALNWRRGNREFAIDPARLGELVSEPDLTSTAIAEVATIDAAFSRLPRRWQEALWMTQVEGQSLAEFARTAGLTPNAASALCLRAREGLRTAWLQAHVRRRGEDPECQWVLDRLGAYSRGKLASGSRQRVDEHLEECPRCATTRARLAFIADALKASTAFVGTGATLLAARAALGATGGAALSGLQPATIPVIGRLGAWLTRAIDGVRARIGNLSAHPAKVAGLTVAATALVAVATAIGLAQDARVAPATVADAAISPPPVPTTAAPPPPDPQVPEPEPVPTPNPRKTTPAPAPRTHTTGSPRRTTPAKTQPPRSPLITHTPTPRPIVGPFRQEQPSIPIPIPSPPRQPRTAGPDAVPSARA